MSKSILLFGATGRVGSVVTALCLEKGWQVTAMVRKEGQVLPEGVSMLQGDIMNPEDVQRAVASGAYDAIISCVGPRTVHAKMRTSSVGMANISKAMVAHKLLRIVAVAGAGILQYNDTKLLQDLQSFPPQLKTISDEHHKAWRMLVNAGLDYTLVCPGYMPTGMLTGSYTTQSEKAYEHIGQIVAADVAHYIVQAVAENLAVGQRVAITQATT